MAALINISDTQFCSSNNANTSSLDVGYAYLSDSDTPQIGQNAINQAKIHPSKISTRFWHELSLEPLSPSYYQARHHADIAWHQLKLHAPQNPNDPVTLIVPSHYSQDTIGLLTGICQSIPMSVDTIVDRAIALATANYAAFKNDFVLLELQLHQALMCFVKVRQSELKIECVEALAGFGLMRIYDKCSYFLRQQYIHKDRFDPMQFGHTEQQLFDQLREQLQSEQTQFSFDIQHAENSFSLDCTAAQLANATTELLDTVYQRIGNLPVLFDSACEGLPGLRLRESDRLADLHSIFSGALQLVSQPKQTNDELRYLRTMKITDAVTSESSVSTNTNSTATVANYLLLNNIGYPAGNYQLTFVDGKLNLISASTQEAHIYLSNEGMSINENASSVTINGTKSIGTKLLQIGDKISLNDVANNNLLPSQVIAIYIKGVV